jgi:putative intracellular protease/amidase
MRGIPRISPLLCLALAAACVKTAAVPQRAVRVAIYRGEGGGQADADRAAAPLHGRTVLFVDENAIRAGALDQADVVIFPGGSATAAGNALREDGRERVRAFVENGGGYVGICAGAYLASTYHPWYLHLLDATVVDWEHWARGGGVVTVELTDAGQAMLAAPMRSQRIDYNQGPLLARDGRSGLPAYEELAVFGSEVADNGAPSGVMVGTTAIARGTYGKGRVMVFSPHPELTVGDGSWVEKAVAWAARSPATR